MGRGKIGQYEWVEFSSETPELVLPDVVRALSADLLGLRGVNVSWDSGLLVASDPGCPPDWSFVGKHAVSPPITLDLAERWPYSSCGFDEWYFFREPPARCDLAPLCNWLGVSVGSWADLNFPAGFDLNAQLHEAKPDVVIGQGYCIYVIARQPEILAHFVGLAKEGA
jgi:hypothetical protein